MLNSWFLTLLTVVIALFIWLIVVPAAHSCQWDDCQKKLVGNNPVRAITNIHRQRVGDIYDPGHGRLQIRNNSRQIIGYIERDKLRTWKEKK